MVIFFILGTIVIFRKQWSSNDGYRDKLERRSKKSKTIISSFHNISKEQVPKLKDAFRDVVDTVSESVSETRRNIKTTILNKLNQVTSTSEKSISLYQYFQTLKGVENHVFMRMSDDTMFSLLSYLSRSELLALSETCSNLWIYLHSDLVWRHMWFRDYGTMWRHPKIVALRRLRGIHWDPPVGATSSISPPATSSPTSSSSSTLFGGASSSKNIAAPASARVGASNEPKQGWKYFYLEFQYAWMDWLLAGFTTPEKCMVGVYGRVLDITAFLGEHPGSPESLVDNAGCDATEMFNEIGHSTFARHILPKLVYWGPSEHGSSSTSRNSAAVGVDDNHLNESYLSTGSESSSLLAPPNWTLGLERQLREPVLVSAVAPSSSSSDLTSITPPHNSSTVGRGWVKYGSRYIRRLHNCRRILRNSDQNRIIMGSAKESMVPGLGGYQQCGVVGGSLSMFQYISMTSASSAVVTEHNGQLRFAFDPVERQWLGWWTCCGKGQYGVAQPPPTVAEYY